MRNKNFYSAFLLAIVFVAPLLIQNIHVLTAHNDCTSCHFDPVPYDSEITQISINTNEHCLICEYEFVTFESPKTGQFSFLLNAPQEITFTLLGDNVLRTRIQRASSRAPPYS